MRYFAYADGGQSPAVTYEIFNVVQQLTGYAKAIYKNHYEDVLDKAFFHILKNYEPETGDLEHYATSVVGTIGLGRYKNEITHDIALETAMNSKSVDDCASDLAEDFVRNQEEILRRNLKQCIRFMVPFFVQDFHFFQTRKPSDRTLEYSEVFDRFDVSVIAEAQNYLMATYSDIVTGLYEESKKCKAKKIQKMRYLKCMDQTVNYMGTINNIVIYKKNKNQHNKLFYSLDFKSCLPKLVKHLYLEGGPSCNHVNLEGSEIFVTMSGELVVGLDNLLESVEKEVLSILLSKLVALKVVTYEEGSSVLLSCSREVNAVFEFEIFGKECAIPLKRLVSKKYSANS